MSIFDLFKKIEKPAAGPVTHIICGLGNPGPKYEETRHNAGFMALDALAEQEKVKINRLKFKALYGEMVFPGGRALLLKPQTMMNASGVSVREAMAFYKLPPERLIVVYDDISLPCGKLRIRAKGSDGGHNGMKDIIYQLGTDQFPRVRVGIGQPPHKDYSVTDWVLGKFSDEEIPTMQAAVKRAAAAALAVAQTSPEQAGNQFNG